MYDYIDPLDNSDRSKGYSFESFYVLRSVPDGIIIHHSFASVQEAILWLDSHVDLYPDFAFYVEKHFRRGPGTKKEVPDEIPAEDPDAPGARTVYSIGSLDLDAETGDFV